MGLFRPDRSRTEGDDPYLLWKVRIFVVGAGLGFIGMMTEIPAVLWTGVVLLTIGVALRFRAPPLPYGDEEE